MSYYDDYLPDPGVNDRIFSMNDRGRISYEEMNKGITPVFFMELTPNPALSEESGRPRYTSEERIKLLVSGDTLNTGVHPVTDEYRRRFADAYAKFKAGDEEKHIVGTPLSAWPAMTPLHIKEFEGLNIFSIEDLAGVSDANITRHIDGRIWREKAKAFLIAAKDGAATEKFAAENERLRNKMEEMQRDMILMRETIKKLETKVA